MTQVSISVITATWNSSKTLEDCLASMKRQTHDCKEHLLIDGGSTDGTVELAKRHLDDIAVFRSEPDDGIYDALNKGIRLASGDVIGFLHSDDFFPSDDVLSEIGIAFQDPSVCAVFGDLHYVSRHDPAKVVRRWKSKSFQLEYLGEGWMPAHPTFYVRRDWYTWLRGFDTRYRISADYLSVLRFFGNPEFRAVYLPKVLVSMRVGGSSNKSLEAVSRKTREDWRALRSCGFSRTQAMHAILGKNLSKVPQFICLGD